MKQLIKGTIDISQLNTPPENHEFETAKFFSDRGKNIVFLKPSDIPGTNSPDFLMDGVSWEVKSPEGNSKRTLEQLIRKAMKQSPNIIFDLRRVKLPEEECISQLENFFRVKPRIKRMIIIKKNKDIIEFPK